MSRHRSLSCLAVLLAAVGGCAHHAAKSSGTSASAAAPTMSTAAHVDKEGFADRFDVPKDRFSSTGRNDYFILEPNYRHVYEGKDEGEDAKLVITVLPETKTVDGVETRVVEERESHG